MLEYGRFQPRVVNLACGEGYGNGEVVTPDLAGMTAV